MFNITQSVVRILCQNFYLRQVNEVNDGDNVFVRCVSVCLSVRSGPVSQTSLKRELNANTSKTLKDTVFKFDKHVPRDSPDVTPYKIFEKVAASGSRDPLNFWALHANSSKTVNAIRTSNLTIMFPGTIGHEPLKIFRKKAWLVSRDPLNFWV